MDPIKFRREEMVISDDRKLYAYWFETEPEEPDEPEATAEEAE